jgi:hypothetical protein
MLEADEDDSDSDTDSDEEEDEVRRALGTDGDDDDGHSRRRNKGEGGEGDWNMDGDEGLTKQLLSFDIYLKGNVSKATTFFKHVGGQTQRFRMFPYVEKKRRVDDYGETIDVGMWLRKSKILEEEAESDDIKDYRRRQAEEEQKVRTPFFFVQSKHHYNYNFCHRKQPLNLLQNLLPLRLTSRWPADCYSLTWKGSVMVVQSKPLYRR